MKVMVCLISEQHVPNLLSVHELRPDLLVLIETEGMRNRNAANNFLKALAIGGLDYLTRNEVVPLKDGDSIEETEKALEGVYRKYRDAEWFVNITGGTKPMSIGAYEFFRQRGNARILYISASKQSKAINFSGGTDIPLRHRISVAEFLAGYGFDVLNHDKMKENEKRSEKWLGLAAEIAARSRNGAVLGFLANLSRISNEQRGRDRGLEISEADGLFLGDDHLGEMIAASFGLAYDDRHFTGALDKYAVRFLTGGWLEVFTWGLLRGLANVRDNVWDVHLGLQIGVKNERLQNDLDVAFMIDQSLRIVECKTGGQEHDREGSDTLYKIEAIRKQLGALRVQSYLVTTSDNVIDSETGKIREHLANRSRLYECTIIDPQKIVELARMYLAGDAKLNAKLAQVFQIGQAV
ncbi:MAG: DUF1887 family protein [Methanothrix sp.]|nr:DUF1887 family CARF protein [Methanothrix sp.]MCX8207743.1 DUF1887 family protein [Methanothrix sp.]